MRDRRTGPRHILSMLLGLTVEAIWDFRTRVWSQLGFAYTDHDCSCMVALEDLGSNENQHMLNPSIRSLRVVALVRLFRNHN